MNGTRKIGMLDKLTTEARNPASEQLDTLSASELVQLMNKEDAGIAEAIEKVKDKIAQAIEIIASALRKDGRLIYVGAGTSGRLGVLDAVECVPTFNAPEGQIVGLIAGGQGAMYQAVEGAEDSEVLGRNDLENLKLSNSDVVVGIAASGRTPYVLGALAYARELGVPTIGFSCNENAELKSCVDVAILPVVGAEILSGSTRLKAGTATKMVLNMLTTAAMVLIGKSYGNLMVDMRASNVKLKERAIRMIQDITGLSEDVSVKLLEETRGELKTAIIMGVLNESFDKATQLLRDAKGQLRRAIKTGADS